MQGRAAAFLALVVAAAAVSDVVTGETIAVKHLDAFKDQVTADLLALETRVHNKHNEVLESVKSNFLQELGKLKSSYEHLSKGFSEADNLRKQISKVQTDLSATKERLDKTNEKIRFLQAENIALKQTLESVKDSSVSVQWKAWREYLSEKWQSLISNSGRYTELIKIHVVKFAELAQSKSVWLFENSKDLYNQYFEHVHPIIVSTSEKVVAWVQQTHQKWRPTLDQQVYKLHDFIHQHPKLSEYHIEKYITVETIAAIVVVLVSVVLRLTLARCCQQKKQTAKSPVQNPVKAKQ